MRFKYLLLFFFLFNIALVNTAEKPAHSSTFFADNLKVAEETAPTPASPQPQKPEEQPSEPVPAPLPSSNEMTHTYESSFVRMLVILIGLVFLVFMTFWILKRLGKGNFKMGAGRTINVIERRALSPKSMLYIVEIEKKKILIAESQLEVRTLASFEESPEENE